MWKLALSCLPAVAGLCLAACESHPPTPPPAASAEAVAPRKAGLWEQRISSGGVTSRTTRVCLDADDDTVLASVATAAGGRCRRQETMKVAEGMWKFTTVCDGAAGKIAADGTVSGDFASRYQILADTSAGGAARRGRLVVDASWKGACPAGMKPGDAVTPDGVKLTAANFASAATH
jgi:hypothetical protein